MFFVFFVIVFKFLFFISLIKMLGVSIIDVFVIEVLFRNTNISFFNFFEYFILYTGFCVISMFIEFKYSTNLLVSSFNSEFNDFGEYVGFIKHW